jgi:predicted Zn-dependent protease
MIAVLALLASCTTVPVTGRRQLSLVEEGELAEYAAQSYEELLSESTVLTDTPDAGMVRRVGGRIARSAEDFMVDRGMEDRLRYYDWEFNLIREDDTANAFCMPGGKIAVYTGILPVTGHEQGLAVVLGHEVAHAIAHHGRERMSHMLLVQLGGAGLSIATREQPELTRQLLFAAYGLGAQVGFLLPYSRTHELEADRIGLILMAQAGYDPREAVTLWQRMEEQGGGGVPEFLSTHPSPGHRIERIREFLPEAMAYYPGG